MRAVRRAHPGGQRTPKRHQDPGYDGGDDGESCGRGGQWDGRGECRQVSQVRRQERRHSGDKPIRREHQEDVAGERKYQPGQDRSAVAACRLGRELRGQGDDQDRRQGFENVDQRAPPDHLAIDGQHGGEGDEEEEGEEGEDARSQVDFRFYSG